MRNLLLKASFLLVSLMLIKGLADIIIPPDKALESLTTQEIDQSSEEAYNALFIGTSRVKRGIVPTIIDSLNPAVRAYNFGENHFAFPYTCKWLEDNLQELPKMSMVVVEMTGPGEEILHFNTWYPYASASVDLTDGWQTERKTLAILRENLLKTYLSPSPNFNRLSRKQKASRSKADRSDGYTPFKRLHVKNYSLAEIEEVVALNCVDRTAPKTMAAVGNSALPEVYCQTIDRLNAKCQEANIQLVFLPPPTFSSAAEMKHCQQMTAYLQQKNIPVLSINHSVLCDAALYYDYRHFNRNGARLYSLELAKALRTLLE